MNPRQLWRQISPSLLLGVLVTSTIPVSAQTITTFSVDPASPAIGGGQTPPNSVTPDDVLTSGPAVFTEGSTLGLEDDFFGGLFEFDNLNALSYGRDPIRNPLYFSVDQVAIGLPVGLPGSDVNQESMVGNAAGDVYKTLPPFPDGTIDFEGDIFPKGNNRLVIKEQELGLDPGFLDPDGDDLDALDLDTELDPEFTFFSVDDLSFPNGFSSPNILVSSGDDTFSTYADGPTDIGIDALDDLDALILFDVTPDGLGGFIPEPNGVLDPGLDQALFSLSSFSPSTFTFTGNPYNPGVKEFLSPADILFTDFTGDFSLWASAPEIGLFPDDEVDALDTTVPEPSSPLSLLAIGILGTALTILRKGRRKN